MTNTSTAIPTDRVIGSVFGLAYGDAIGDPVEFRKYHEIVKAGGASVPERFRITDDTQMSLAVWYALDGWTPGASLGMLRLNLAGEFLAWADDPDNNRAPGTTCLTSLARLQKMGLGRWTAATSPISAGCGSVMRAPWIGLHPRVSDAEVAPVAMAQAVLTHGPAENAYCAAALAELTRALARGEVAPGQAVDWLLDVELDRLAGAGYDAAALSDVARQCRQTEDAYHAEGVAHVEWVAHAAGELAARLADDPWGFDPCAVAGEGWRAREAVAVAVGILAGLDRALPSFPARTVSEVAVDMLVRAAETNGDSDSIGAITGALAGAAFGDVFKTAWRFRLEARYRTELDAVVARLKF